MARAAKTSAELKLLQRIDDLMEEVQALKADVDEARQRAIEAEVGDSSGLADILPEAEAELVELTEGFLLRALTAKEAYFLGQMVQGFGPPRCIVALRKKTSSKDPIRAAYAMLQAGAMGQPAPKKDTYIPTVRYMSLDDAAY